MSAPPDGSGPGEARRTRSVRGLLRAGSSLGLLGVVAWAVDPGTVIGRLGSMRPGWVAAAVVVSILQVVVSAWRWRYTARRLGIDLPFGRAVWEYYLATFLNQILPGGVLGDVSRAWRDAGARPGADGEAGAGASRRLAAVHAVILERLSGQVVMTLSAFGAACLLLLPRPGGFGAVVTRHPLSGVHPLVAVPTVLAVLSVVLWGMSMVTRRLVRLPPAGLFLEDARRALLGRALAVQALLSIAVVASYVLVFVCGARAVGLETSAGLVALLAPPILVSMLIPVSVAGWGLREGAAALLWGAVGLSAADGVAVAVAYGLLALVSSLPGALPLFTGRGRRAPDRRGDRHPVGSGGPEPGSPRPGTRWGGG